MKKNKTSLILSLWALLLSGAWQPAMAFKPVKHVSKKGNIHSLNSLTYAMFATATLRIPVTATAGTGMCGFDGAIRVTTSGVSVVNLSNTVGKGISWKVEVTAAGTYQLQWSYAGGGSAAVETARLLVNRTVIQEDVPFPRPKDSNTFLSTALLPVTLDKGVNEIRIEANQSATMGDIAWLEVTGENPMAADCSQEIGSGGNDDPNATFTLAVAANPSVGGSVSVSPASGPYVRNSQVTLTATPASGYVFAGWSGNATGTALTTTLVMNSDKSVIANFAVDTTPSSFTLTTSVQGQGTVSPANDTFDRNSTATLTATPATGWSFIGWSGDTTGTTNPLPVKMYRAKNIVANFMEGNGVQVDNTMRGFAAVSGEGYTITTGGQGGPVITISTFAQLEAWAATREKNNAPEIVHISGKITSPASTLVTIKNGSNISILGIGSTAELENVGLNIREYKNVIVRNLKIHEVLYPNDGLTIDESQHVWIDHCEFHSKIGTGIGVDTYDGLLDIKKGSRYVTVSWSYFHDHMKTVLVGHTDNAAAEAEDSQIRVTFHHNYFHNTDGRNPSLRWGAAHLFNNYFRNIFDYGIALRQGAHGLIENNVYENVKLPITTNKFDGVGFACERGNLFTGTSGANSITQTGCDWWTATTLPYTYTMDPVASVVAIVPANVGVGKVNVTSNLTSSGKDLEKGARNVVVYPNPAEKEINFEITLVKRGAVKISLFTAGGSNVGRVVSKTLEAGRNVVEYNASGLTPGLYLYQVETPEGTVRQKVVIK